MQVSVQCVCMCVCVCLPMHKSTFSLEGHLEHNCSLVFYCCPSAELTGRDGVVTAMCGLLGCQCFCVWCVNWDPQPLVSSCATADDIPLGFSACFLLNRLSRAFMRYSIIHVYNFLLQSAITSLPSAQFISTVWQKWEKCLLCVQFQKMRWRGKPMTWGSQERDMSRIFFKH